ncbi:hypothetical protein [Halostreptopolyspora alba]|uniref:Glucanase n=1 Tax=Halostreptopolyspora alba TaxID=2487137 RepID=A0A3N0EG80_9ACTN|nr:hypothetical protein EFW17_03235 [Nocardiopsaceae bacterium YIM 96095]
MPTTRLPGPITAALILTLTTTPPATADTYPGATVSRYTPLTGTENDRVTAREAGCAEGEKGTNGVRFLIVGTQESGATLRHPGTTASSTSPRAPAEHAATVAAAWATGFAQCRTNHAQAELALTVNNKSDGGINGDTAGGQWAAIVTEAAQNDNHAVTITGGIDAEPSWSTPTWARAWVDAFTGATDRTLYAGNSADGCPQHGSSTTTCANEWTLADLHHVSTGAAPTIEAIPQIHRTDGTQTRQWAAVSSWGARHGSGPIRFAGAMSQNTACDQRRDCTATDNTPKAAWTQLWHELNSHDETAISRLPTATDIRWPQETGT